MAAQEIRGPDGGVVRFEVDAPAELYIDECNCSMCTRTAYLHLIVSADRFRITRGRDALSLYTFNTGTAKHYFCPVCGIHTHGEGQDPKGQPMAAVNLRTLDKSGAKEILVEEVPAGEAWDAVRDRLRRAASAENVVSGDPDIAALRADLGQE